MSENMSEIPDGWNIQRVAIYDGPSVDFRYEARRWQTSTPHKKHWWSRRTKRLTGWFPVYSSRFRDETAEWIRRTDQAMKATK
jgi:hypothetical protein